MSFVLSEFAIIMFLTFILILIASAVISLNFTKFLTIDTYDLRVKTGNRPSKIMYRPNFGVIDESEEVLKEQYTHFKNR
jgi:hypothetical protein